MSAAKVIQINVILFSDLENENSDSFTFDSFSYGDADYTLVTPQTLISELEDATEDFQALIGELRHLPEGVLVAFQS
jgi:hypothetical protein